MSLLVKFLKITIANVSTLADSLKSKAIKDG